MLFDLKADNYAKVWINSTYINDGENQFSFGSAGSLINNALQPGLNTVTLRLGDYGGIVGMNYRIDVTVSSCEDIEGPIVVEDPNTAPTADAGADQTIDCVVGSADVTLNGSGADADGDDLSYSWTDADGTVYEGADLTTSLTGGVHTFTLTVDDGNGGTATDDVTVTVNVDDTAPVIAELADVTASNDAGVCGAEVSFDLSAAATDDCELVSVVADPASGSFFPVGDTEVTVTATDAAGNESSASFTVTVEDTEAPAFAAVAEAVTLWPPNHKYHSFDAADFVASVGDNCSDLSAADVVITSVTSDELEDAKGGGDGKTRNDIVINGSSVDLRAERMGGGNGRVYTIYLAVSDEYGNVSEASAQVHVPHDKKRGAVDDGAAYSVSAGSGLGKGSGFDTGSVAVIPSEFGLSGNYPNPFNPSTQISYSMPEAGNVSLMVYDIRGALVSSLVDAYQSAGIHTVNFDGSELPAGTYIYVLNTGGQRFVERMLLVK